MLLKVPMSPSPELDDRFSDPDATPTPWPVAAEALAQAELYWLTTVRADGRPHVTPLIGLAEEGVFYFCTGLEEQKARNLEQNDQVAVTTGTNTWASGLDVIVEGTATRVTDAGELQRAADAYEAKYGSVWHWEVRNQMLASGSNEAALFKVEPTKVLAFAKDPHGQTRYRLKPR
jgi:nitroimidazol reductase NimA-like FMN-containing flavoprotein (pyridoxamine 5'-phosphate oxidase superfamily)